MVNHNTSEVAGDLRNYSDVKSAIQLLRTYSATQIQSIIDDVKKNGSVKVGDDTLTEKDIKDLQLYKNKATVKKSLCFFKNGRFYISKSGGIRKNNN